MLSVLLAPIAPSLPYGRYLSTDSNAWEVPLPEPGFHNNSHMKCPRILAQEVSAYNTLDPVIESDTQKALDYLGCEPCRLCCWHLGKCKRALEFAAGL